MKAVVSVVFLLLVSITLLHTQELSKSDEAYIDSIMSANYKLDEPGAAILLAIDGKPVFRKAYGLASVELNVPNKPEYLFSIGSMTKQFTAVCILQLAQDGKLVLKDDIKKYLPEYDTHGKIITLENLLSHTSGITSYTEKEDFDKKITIDHSKNEIMKYFMEDSLIFDPGTDWSYSNSGYVVLGLIVEKVSGVPLSEYMQKHLFEPAGMTNTVIGSYDHVTPNAVTGYESAGDKRYKVASYLSWTWPYAAGDIVSCVDDMQKWDEALYTDKLLKKEWREKAWKSFVLASGQETNYGFGWGLGKYNGMNVVSHGGAINGFLSDGIRIPSKHLYLVVLSNKAVKSPSEFSNLIALRAAGNPVKEHSAITLSSQHLQEYVGAFNVHRVGGRITKNTTKNKMYRYIILKNDTLFTQRTGGSKTPLIPVGTDLFMSKASRMMYKFNRDKDQKIVSLELYTEPLNYGPNELETKADVPMPAERTAISLDEKQLAPYKGKYDFGGGFIMTVTIDGNKIFTQATGQPSIEIYPETETKFFLKVVDATIEFVKDANGTVTGLVLTQGRKMEAKKIE